MATVWEQIQEKRKAVEELQGIYQIKKKEFEADGVVTDAEKAKLATISNGLNTAQAKVKALEEEFKANKQKWLKRVPDFEATVKQRSELFDWGDKSYPTVKQWTDDVAGKAEDMAWLDAIATLDKAMIIIKKPYEEYKRQLKEKEKYNDNHDDIEDAGKECSKSNFVKKDSLAQSMTAFANSMKSAEDAAADKRFDDANGFLDSAKSTIETVKKEIGEIREKYVKCQTEFTSLKGDLAIYATSEFKTVQEMNDALQRATEAIIKQMQEFDFDGALSGIEAARLDVEKMKAEKEAKEKEKADWKAKEPELAEAKKKAEEVKEFGGKDAPPDVGAKADDAEKKATEDQFKDAVKTAEDAKAEADKAYKKMQEQKKRKEEAAQELSDIDKKLEALLASI